MTNEEQHKTPGERAKEFRKFCATHDCASCPASHGDINECVLFWLAFEAEDEKPMPCPFCGSACEIDDVCTNEDQSSKYVSCTNDRCMYQSPIGENRSVAVTAHNRVCRAVKASPKLYDRAQKLVSAFDKREMTAEHIEALRSALAEAAGEEENK